MVLKAEWVLNPTVERMALITEGTNPKSSNRIYLISSENGRERERGRERKKFPIRNNSTLKCRIARSIIEHTAGHMTQKINYRHYHRAVSSKACVRVSVLSVVIKFTLKEEKSKTTDCDVCQTSVSRGGISAGNLITIIANTFRSVCMKN